MCTTLDLQLSKSDVVQAIMSLLLVLALDAMSRQAWSQQKTCQADFLSHHQFIQEEKSITVLKLCLPHGMNVAFWVQMFV